MVGGGGDLCFRHGVIGDLNLISEEGNFLLKIIRKSMTSYPLEKSVIWFRWYA